MQYRQEEYIPYHGDIHVDDEADDVKSPIARSPRQRIGSSLPTLTGSTPPLVYTPTNKPRQGIQASRKMTVSKRHFKVGSSEILEVRMGIRLTLDFDGERESSYRARFPVGGKERGNENSFGIGTMWIVGKKFGGAAVDRVSKQRFVHTLTASRRS